MAVAQSISFFVAHGLEELVDPDGGIDGEAFLSEGREGRWAGGGRDHSPEAGDTHGGGQVSKTWRINA